MQDRPALVDDEHRTPAPLLLLVGHPVGAGGGQVRVARQRVRRPADPFGKADMRFDRVGADRHNLRPQLCKHRQVFGQGEHLGLTGRGAVLGIEGEHKLAVAPEVTPGDLAGRRRQAKVRGVCAGLKRLAHRSLQAEDQRDCTI